MDTSLHRPWGTRVMVQEPDAAPAPTQDYLRVTVPLTVITGGSSGSPGNSPHQRLLLWARKEAGWDLAFSDIAVSLATRGGLDAAMLRWLQARVDTGFVDKEDRGKVSLGIDGLNAPVLNRNLPDGQVLLMKKPRP
jgi:hypothetical protein